MRSSVAKAATLASALRRRDLPRKGKDAVLAIDVLFD
jgi:hypothetical protein